VSRSRRTLPLQPNVLHDEDATSAHLDTLDVLGVASALDVRAELASRVRYLVEKLLGHTQMRKPYIPHFGHVRLSVREGKRDLQRCTGTLYTSCFLILRQDQELLLNELRRSGFCDVFECSPGVNLWCCFLCNHPERAIGFLQDSQPVIEGQLKEKKGRWKLFKRWKTRYFTLSGAHLSYKESVCIRDLI
jgi:hypothetical protein